MTVTATSYTPITYNGNGSTSVFNITFQFYEIAVIHIDGSGSETEWVEKTHYKVTGGQGAAGSVTIITTVPAIGEKLRIERRTVKSQVENFDLDNEILENSLQRSVDRMAMVMQETAYEAEINLTEVETAQTAAEAAKLAAETAETNAEIAEENAEVAQTAAELAETNAGVSESNAGTSEANAAASALAAVSSAAAAAAASEHMAWTYKFDDGIADADPGVEALRLNHASLMSATYLYMDEDATEGNIGSLMDVWDDSTSTVKGILTIKNPQANTNWFQAEVTGALVDAGEYRKIPINPVGYSGSFTDGDTLLFSFVRNGDAGTGAVDSFNGRSGFVVPANNDYSISQISGAGALASLDEVPDNSVTSDKLADNIQITETLGVGDDEPEFRYKTGGSTDLNWKNVCDVVIGTGLYKCAQFEVLVQDAETNSGSSADITNLRYTVSARRSQGSQDSYDDALVSGPENEHVRCVKNSTGVYEIQVRQYSNYRHVTFRIRNTSHNNDVTINYYQDPTNGSTSGTIYTVTDPDLYHGLPFNKPIEVIASGRLMPVAGAYLISSKGIGSLADYGTGDFYLPFLTAQPDTNYHVYVSQQGHDHIHTHLYRANACALTTSGFKIRTGYTDSGNQFAHDYGLEVAFMVVRDD